MNIKKMLYDYKHDRWIRPFFAQYRTAFVLALSLGVLIYLCAAALMFTSGYLISAAAQVPESIFALHIPLAFVQIFGISKPILRYIERLSSHDWILRTASSMRNTLYQTLERDALRFRITHRVGDALGLLAEDIGHIQNLYLRTIFPIVVAWTLWFLVLVGAGFYSTFLACTFALMFLCVAVLSPLVSVLLCGARRMRYKALHNELYAELTDNVLGVSDWVFAQRMDDYIWRYKKTSELSWGLARIQDRFDYCQSVVLQVIFGAQVILLLGWAATYFGGQASMGARLLVAFTLGFFPLIDTLVPLPVSAVDIFSYGDSLKRLNDLSDVDKKGVFSADCCAHGEKFTAKGAASRRPVGTHPSDRLALCPQKPYNIQVKGVCYTYPQSTQRILNNFDLFIPAGQKIAILGVSGTGKSTLATLIQGSITPDRGSISLGGFPTADLGDASSCFIGVIQQHTYLFHMTLLENVRIGRADATDAEVSEALERVGLHDLLERLPQGLHTVVDEAGVCFSGGEAQRIALARILLQDAPVIILDEPCVGLDPSCEKALLKTLFEVLDRKTVLMITHHLLGVSACDRVIFIEDGQVGLDGVPTALAQNNERYQKLLEFDRSFEGLL